MSRDIFDCQWSQEGERSCRRHLVGRRMLLNMLQSTGQSLTTKNYPAPSVDSVKIEKPSAKNVNGNA